MEDHPVRSPLEILSGRTSQTDSTGWFLCFCRAVSEVLHAPLPYEDITGLRDRMWEISPTLCRYDTLETPSVDIASLGFTSLAQALKGSKVDSAEKLDLPVKNFYQTDVVSRSSVTMAQVRCLSLFSLCRCNLR